MYFLGDYQTQVDRAVAALNDNNILARIRARDHTVWKPEPDEIANRLGWLDAPETMRANLPRLTAFAESARADGFRRALLLGMGGSSLAPEVFRKTFGVQDGCSRIDLAVLDSADPDAVRAQAERWDFEQTLFIVATKSGGTVETLSFFKYFYNQIDAEPGRQIVAITDPGSKLEDIAKRHNFRETFLNDSNIGGRYSALSYFGLVPAALLGVDVETLLARASAVQSEAAGGKLGATLGALAQAGRDKLTFVVSPEIAGFGDWVEQLIAESTGKEGKGITPVVGEAPGAVGLYSTDRTFVQLCVRGEPSQAANLRALAAQGHPVIRIQLNDKYDLGAQFFLWETATAVAGHVMGINPFDQPNVEAAKQLAREMVAQYRAGGALPAGDSAPVTAAALADFLAAARPGDYIALQAYVQPTAETDAALQALRTQLRDRYRLATTVGYGPRFLHSTGQLHKGDRGNGLFVQLVSDAATDLPIPDEAGSDKSSISFGVLKQAQALGDAQALRAAGRRVIRFDLETDVVGRIGNLSQST